MEAIMGLAAAIRQWRSSWAHAYELDPLDKYQREALARDIGLSQDVLAALVTQGPQAAAELPRLMYALGLAPERTADKYPAVMRDMSTVCSGCELKRRCRNDIDRGLAPVVQRYCPNTQTIKALHRERYELVLP
jgi:hypothetical protein